MDTPAPTPPSEPPLEVIEYDWLRFLIGAIAALFPAVLIVGDRYLCHRPPLDSLSDYYDGPMRNVFVGGLTAIGVFLLSYRGESLGPWGCRWRALTELRLWTWLKRLVHWIFQPHRLGIIAGLAAIGVAFDPASCPAVEKVHYSCAAVLFAALARFSWLFGETPGTNWPPSRRSLWRWFYRSLSGLIIAMMLWIAWRAYQQESFLWQESTAVWAFAAGWIVVSGKALTLGRAAWSSAMYALAAPIKAARWLVNTLR